MAKKETNTHPLQELIFLRVGLNKAAEKKRAAIMSNHAAGEDTVAREQELELAALVGEPGDRSGTTLERLQQGIDHANESASKTGLFSVDKREAHAIEIGLPLLAKRMRTIQQELKSWGRDDVADWCEEQANIIDSTLKDHYDTSGQDRLPLDTEAENRE